MKLYIIRHGDPNYELDCLTEIGKEQAEAVAPRIASYGIDRIITSPQGRARQTADPLCKLLDKPYDVASWAHEIYFQCNHPTKGKVFGTAAPEEIMRSEEVLSMGDRWHEHPFYVGTGAGEEVAGLHTAADLFLEKLGYKREGLRYKVLRENNETIALFCHGGFATVLLGYILGIPEAICFSAFGMSQTGVTLVEFKHPESGYTAPRCRFHNDTSHLFAKNMEIR